VIRSRKTETAAGLTPSERFTVLPARSRSMISLIKYSRFYFHIQDPDIHDVTPFQRRIEHP
jgi:hypothetical protein